VHAPILARIGACVDAKTSSLHCYTVPMRLRSAITMITMITTPSRGEVVIALASR
jgi:hypothetical protein